MKTSKTSTFKTKVYVKYVTIILTELYLRFLFLHKDNQKIIKVSQMGIYVGGKRENGVFKKITE